MGMIRLNKPCKQRLSIGSTNEGAVVVSTIDISSPQSITALLLNNADNVYCVLRDHQTGDFPVLVDATGNHCSCPILLDNIPLGHKVARVSIDKDAPVIKYGTVIGYATQAIPAGSHVHLHNLIGSLQATLAS